MVCIDQGHTHHALHRKGHRIGGTELTKLPRILLKITELKYATELATELTLTWHLGDIIFELGMSNNEVIRLYGTKLGTCRKRIWNLSRWPPSTTFFLALLDLLASPQVTMPKPLT